MHVVRGGGVVQEIEDADAGEGLGNDVGEERGRRAEVKPVLGTGEDGKDVGELGETIDNDEEVRDVEAVGVPEEHPC